MYNAIYQIGGIFSILTFIHFTVDWIFQTHAEAMVKHNNALIRAKHCAIYTVGFLPIYILLNVNLFVAIISSAILFISHFILDTYYIAYLWAKHIRKPTEMLPPNDNQNGFINFVKTNLGQILMIAIDQITHIFFVLIVAIIIYASR